MVMLELLVVIHLYAYCGAVPGTTIRVTAALLIAAEPILATASTALVFG